MKRRPGRPPGSSNKAKTGPSAIITPQQQPNIIEATIVENPVKTKKRRKSEIDETAKKPEESAKKPEESAKKPEETAKKPEEMQKEHIVNTNPRSSLSRSDTINTINSSVEDSNMNIFNILKNTPNIGKINVSISFEMNQ